MSASGRPPLAPFGRRLAQVTATRRLGPYSLVSVFDHAGPHNPRPGQFYMLATEHGWDGGRPYLPRAFSHCRSDGHGNLDFLIDPIGPGTTRLCSTEEGERLYLMGPLGNGFDLDHRGSALLVGGGIGVAPLVALGDELEPRAEVLLGFRSADHAAAGSLFPVPPLVVTDDGSVGRRALVTDLLREALDRDPKTSVYSCGPPAMLEAVRAQCSLRGTRAFLAMEAGMACGYGACFGCVQRTASGYVRLCVDGPVLEAAQLETALAVH